MFQSLSPYWLQEPDSLVPRIENACSVLATATLADIIALSDKARDRAFDEWGVPALSAEEKPYGMDSGIALLSLRGSMTKGMSWYSYYYGETSTAMLAQKFEMAARDPDVKSGLLKIDSGGGNVDGTAEFGAALAAFAAVKPLWVYVDGTMASAALWAGSYGHHIYASSENAGIGSIGVITAMVDASKSAYLKESGIRYIKIDTGTNKAPGAFFSPITDEQLQVVKDRVHQLGANFARVVSEQRGLNLTIGEGIADGRMFLAPDAVDNGLIDGIAPLSAVLERMRSGVGLTKDKVALAKKATYKPKPKQAGAKAEAEGETLMPRNDLAEKTFKEKAEAAFKALFGESADAEAPKADETPDVAAITSERDAAKASLETATATINDLTAKVEALGATVKVATGALELFRAAAGEAYKGAGDDKIAALVTDGVTARSNAAGEFSKQMNRAIKPGTMTPERALAQFKGKTLAEITEAIAPILESADEKYAPEPAAARRSADAETARAEADKTDAEKAEAKKAADEKAEQEMADFHARNGA